MTPKERATRREVRRSARRERQAWVIEEAEAVIRAYQNLPPYALERPVPPDPRTLLRPDPRLG